MDIHICKRVQVNHYYEMFSLFFSFQIYLITHDESSSVIPLLKNDFCGYKYNKQFVDYLNATIFILIQGPNLFVSILKSLNKAPAR